MPARTGPKQTTSTVRHEMRRRRGLDSVRSQSYERASFPKGSRSEMWEGRAGPSGGARHHVGTISSAVATEAARSRWSCRGRVAQGPVRRGETV